MAAAAPREGGAAANPLSCRPGLRAPGPSLPLRLGPPDPRPPLGLAGGRAVLARGPLVVQPDPALSASLRGGGVGNRTGVVAPAALPGDDRVLATGEPRVRPGGALDQHEVRLGSGPELRDHLDRRERVVPRRAETHH